MIYLSYVLVAYDLFVSVEPDFRLAGESLFFAWPKKSNQKKGHPTKLACGFSALLDSLERGITGRARRGFRVWLFGPTLDLKTRCCTA